MSLKKRIISCLILLAGLGVILLIGYRNQKKLETMGNSVNGDDGKKIALTFDDGPHPYYTRQLLKGLKEREVKVTFFITGKNVETYPDIVKEIYEEGG